MQDDCRNGSAATTTTTSAATATTAARSATGGSSTGRCCASCCWRDAASGSSARRCCAATTRNAIREFAIQGNGVVIGKIRSPVDAEILAIERANRVPLRLLATHRTFLDFKIRAAFKHGSGQFGAIHREVQSSLSTGATTSSTATSTTTATGTSCRSTSSRGCRRSSRWSRGRIRDPFTGQSGLCVSGSRHSKHESQHEHHFHLHQHPPLDKSEILLQANRQGPTRAKYVTMPM
jgi:hypothetical protein